MTRGTLAFPGVRSFALRTNQSITLKAEQLEALALHLDQVASSIRQLLATSQDQPVQVSDMRHVELILDSTDSFLREIQGSAPTRKDTSGAATPREGRPRRTRRRKP